MDSFNIINLDIIMFCIVMLQNDMLQNFLKSVLPPRHCHSNRPDFGKIVAPNETSLFWAPFHKKIKVVSWQVKVEWQLSPDLMTASHHDKIAFHKTQIFEWLLVIWQKARMTSLNSW